MDHKNIYFDTILVPLSFILIVGYHVYLWYCFKHQPLLTTIGLDKMRRRKWAQTIIKDYNEILAVQSGRNALMGSILTAAITIIFLGTPLAAITNNTYNASNLLKDPYFGSQSTQMLALKYGSVSISLLMGFLCSSLAVGCLNEINFLINVTDFEPGYVLDMLERGDSFALVGNRALYISFPLLVWMLIGPVPMILSSMALVWVLNELDFTVNVMGKKSPIGPIQSIAIE